MPSLDPSSNRNTSSSTFQRLAIGVGTFVVVVLTVLAALFLTMRELPDTTLPDATPLRPTATGVAVVSPASATPLLQPTSTSVATPTPPPTFPPSATPTFTPEATLTPLPPPPTDTPTPLPPPPTETPTPLPPLPTDTPVPAVTQAPPPPVSNAVCQPPPDWVPYTTQLGDTLNSLASRTNTSVYQLQQVNCLEIFTLQIGQTIYLPFTPPTPTVTTTPTPLTPSPTPSRTGTPSPTPRAPEVFSNVPESGSQAGEVIVAVQGRNFEAADSDFRVELRTGGVKVPLQLGDLRTSTSFEVIVPPGLTPATYDLWVINPDDQFDIRSSAYQVLP